MKSNMMKVVVILGALMVWAAWAKADNEYDVFELARNGTPEQLMSAFQKGANFNVSRKAYDYEADEELYTEEFEFGETPLHIAAMYNHNAGSIRFLLEAGLAINEIATSGNSIIATPLSCALKHKNLTAVSELLKAGANPHIYTNDGNNFPGSAFHIVASDYRNYSEIKALIDELIKAGGDVNNHSNFTRKEIRYFLKHETLPGDKYGWSPSDPWGIASIGISNAANHNFWSSCTPLIYAVVSDNPNTVNILLDAGADPKIRNIEGKTALDYASNMPATTAISPANRPVMFILIPFFSNRESESELKR